VTLVLDASAAFGFLVSNRWDAAIRNAHELVAPDLIVAEVLNARWKVARSGGVAPDVDPTLEFLTRLRITPSLPYAPAAVRLAERLGHPIYDCLYVALAQAEHAKLLTADIHLVRKLHEHKLTALLAS
jgi:predicted nucleic acid-binding protein